MLLAATPATLRETVDSLSNSTLFLLLTFTAFVIYLAQVPFITVNQDVIIYALRGHAAAPILDASYTNDMRTGNIHIFHTVLMWLAYQIAPAAVYNTVWPAGVVSAISGALIVGLTYLIWERLGVDRYAAVLSAVAAGIIPSIWYHNLIGEIYALELLLVLLSLYCFCAVRYLAATVCMTLALLTTPVVGLSFSVLLLSIRVRQEFIAAIVVGVLSISAWLLTMYLLSPMFFEAFMPALHEFPKVGRGRALVNLALIVAINLNFLALFFLIGLPTLWREYRRFIPGLLVAAILPQLYLLYESMAWFFFELGSFQLLLLWTLALPVGLGLARPGFPGQAVRIACITATVSLAVWNWGVVSERIAGERLAAGFWLKSQSQSELTFIGTSDACLPAAIVYYDYDLDLANRHCIEDARPDSDDLLETGERELIVVNSKAFHPSVRSLVAQLVPSLKDVPWDPYQDITSGTLTLLYENDSTGLYRWTAPVE